MADTVEIIIRTLAEGAGVTDAEMGMMGLNQAIELGQKVIEGIHQAYDATIGSTLEYALSVREVAAQTGMTTQATSQMIDLFDKFDVSTTALTMAQKTLAKEGLSLNIDTLKQLSDEYNNIQNQSAKTEFLVKNFGRSGLEMADMLGQGSAALQKYNDETEQSNVLTPQQTQQMQMLSIQQKEVADSGQGLANTVSFQVAPAYSRALSMSQDFVSSLDDQIQKHGILSMIMTGSYANVFGSFVQKRVEAANAAQAEAAAAGITNDELIKAQGAAQRTTESYDGLIGATQNISQETSKYYSVQSNLLTQQDTAKAALDKLEAGYYGYSGAAASVATSLANVNKQIGDFVVGISGTDQDLNKLKKEQDDLQSKLSLTSATWGQNSEAVKQAQEKYDQITGQISAAAAAHEAALKRMAYSDFMQAESSKAMTLAEFTKQEQVGVSLGVFTQAEATTAIKMRELVNEMADGKISAEEFAKAIANVDKVSSTAGMSATGQEAAAAWKQSNTPQATTPTQTAATGQEAAAQWQAQQSKEQQAAQTAQQLIKQTGDTAASAVATFTQGVSSNVESASKKMADLLGQFDKLKGENFTITVKTTVDSTAGGSEYP